LNPHDGHLPGSFWIYFTNSKTMRSTLIILDQNHWFFKLCVIDLLHTHELMYGMAILEGFIRRAKPVF
jgi:hypothetical protein